MSAESTVQEVCIQFNLSINYNDSVTWPRQWRLSFLQLFLFIPLIVKWTKRACECEILFLSREGYIILKLFLRLTHFFLDWDCELCCSGNFRQTVPQANYFPFLSNAVPQNQTQTTKSCSKICNFICRKWKQICWPNKNQMLIKNLISYNFVQDFATIKKKRGT